MVGGRPNYGPTAQERTKRLLEALLAYANDELDGAERLQIEANWQTQNKLVIRTKVRFLEELTAKYQQDGRLNKEQIREALRRLKDWLEILEDNRTKTKGSEDWHFTLTLWSKDKEENLKRFELEWESRRAKRTRTNPPGNPGQPRAGIDWRQVCRDMLEAQNQGRLTTNPLTVGDGVTFELDEIYVPLGLVERKQRDRRSGDVSPERGSQLYEPEAQDEIVQTFQHDEFFEQVLRLGQSRRIAIIGEPGVGKTTLLQKIAAWVLDNTEDIPIWISLADLQQGQTLKDYILRTWLERALPHIRRLSLKAVPSLLEVPKPLQNALANEFCKRKVWLLLDAADEMVVESGNALTQIANQLTGWVADARVVLTCRLNVWDAGKNTLEVFDTYRNLDFSYGDAQTPDQVEQFIRHWFKGSPELAESLRSELDQPGKERIFDAVKNPLRLALLCRSWTLGQGELPNTKAGLYKQFTEALYEWKQDRFPTTSTQRRQLNRALGELAKRAVSEEKTKFRLRHRLVCEVLAESDEELFQLALQLGWLNQVGVAVESENRGEKVYAFFHPTFQEYFAAQAIDDWRYFLNHIPRNPAEGTYRIFEPQWKEAMKLWLGREDVLKEQKEEFINALVEFEDGWENFYGYQAYFLAAIAIGEFGDCSRSDEIVEKAVRWGFGNYSKKSKEEYSRNLAEGARQALRESDRNRGINALSKLLSTKNRLVEEELQKASLKEQQYLFDRWSMGILDKLLSRVDRDRDAIRNVLKALLGDSQDEAINALRKLLAVSQDDVTCLGVASELMRAIPTDSEATTALTKLAQNSKYTWIRRLAADRLEQKSKVETAQSKNIFNQTLQTLQKISKNISNQTLQTLQKISKENEQEIADLVNQVQVSQDEFARRQAAVRLGEIGAGNPTAIAAVIYLIESCKLETYRQDAIKSLEKIGKGDERAVCLLLEVLRTKQNQNNSNCQKTYFQAATSLKRMGFVNSEVIYTLIDWLRDISWNTSQLQEAYWELWSVLRSNLFPEVASYSDLVVALKDCHNFESDLYFERYLYCYEIIWHCAQNMTYPAFYQAWHNQLPPTPIKQNLNLAEFPQILTAAIANDPTLSQTLHLICIDGSKFIDRDNPATKIYTEMVRSGCPKCEDGTPKTMQELQAYWDLLDSDKRVVLVFYEGKGFSEIFLDALSKFDGAICVITAPILDNIPLQCFSPNQAIADVVEWLKKVALEA